MKSSAIMGPMINPMKPNMAVPPRVPNRIRTNLPTVSFFIV
jgi:hypothetical protein